MVPNFHEERRNSTSIATNFGEIRGHFSQHKIIGLDQELPWHSPDLLVRH